MAHADAHDPEVLAHYEGLIFTTTQMLAPSVEEDFEDIQQLLRMKVFRALLAYDPHRSTLPRDRWVFGAVRNQVKDIAKRRRRAELFLEDLAPACDSSRERFDERYLSSSHDEVYGEVEDEPLPIPDSMTRLERRVVALLYRDYRQTEIAERLGLDRRDVERLMRSIRDQLGATRDCSPAPVLDVALELDDIAVA